MIDLLGRKATHNRISEIVYVVLNALLPIAVLLLVRIDPPYLAFALIILSKWRILSLRPRFWWANVKANMVDLVVGLSVVGLLYLSSSSFMLQIVLTIGYGVWLLVIKPRSNAQGVALQAGIAQFVGLLTVFHFSVVIPEALVVLGSWAVGAIAARHLVSNYDEPHVELLAAVWGLLVAQLAWLMYHWTTVYNLGLAIRIPQITLVMLVIGFCAARMYHLSKRGELSPTTLRGTAVFGVILLAVILFFSSWDVTV